MNDHNAEPADPYAEIEKLKRVIALQGIALAIFVSMSVTLWMNVLRW